jgi:hypothetical protein
MVNKEKLFDEDIIKKEFQIKENDGENNNCLFTTSLCLAMSIESCNHKELRNLIVDKMNNKLFSRKHDIKKYKENMRKPGIKGGDMELTTFAHWKQCIITIYD